MNRNHQHLNTARAKEMELVDSLSPLDYQLARIRSANYWYLSQLRVEKKPSLKVNRKLSCLYDHGLGKGGNLVDFGIFYHNCTVSELLKNLVNSFSFHQPIARRIESPQAVEKDHHLRVLDDCNLHSFVLLNYLEERKIPLQLAFWTVTKADKIAVGTHSQ